MTKIDFKTSNYFARYVYYTGYAFIALGLAVLNINLIATVILSIVGLIFITTHYRLSIDLSAKAYHDYIWILGLKIGEGGKFNTIEYLFIKKSNVSQAMNLRVASSSIQKDVYDGYLKFSEQEKLHLLTLDNKDELMKKLKEIADRLKVGVVDYSGEQPVKV